MKKIISVFLALMMLCLVPCQAFAQASNYEEMNIMMGDINDDGKVTAMDARTALRYAARLEPSSDVELLCIDADGDGRISASDARSILRVAARISKFVAGFDGNGTPNVINTIRSNVFYMEIENHDESQNANISLSVARNGNDIYMITSDSAIMGEMGLGDVFKITKCGMMVADDKIYALMSTESADIAMYISKEMQQELDLEPEMLYEISDMIEDFIPADIGQPEKKTVDGKEMFCYSYNVNGAPCIMYIGTNGILYRIDTVAANGKAETLIKFNKISGDKSDGYFSLDSFDELW